MQYSLDSDAQDIYNKRIAPVENSLPSYDEAFERLCTEPRYAVAISSHYIQSLQASKRLNCTVIGVPQASFHESLSMPIVKGCPYIRIIDHKYVSSFNCSRSLPLSCFSARVKQSSWAAWLIKIGQIDFPENSVRNYHSTLRETSKWRR